MSMTLDSSLTRWFQTLVIVRRHLHVCGTRHPLHHFHDVPHASNVKLSLNISWILNRLIVDTLQKLRSRFQPPSSQPTSQPTSQTPQPSVKEARAHENRMSNVSSIADSMQGVEKPGSNRSSSSDVSSIPYDEYQKLSTKFKTLYKQSTKMKVTIDSLAKERDFYFQKLRQIEVLCQESESKEHISTELLNLILYSTSDDQEDDTDAQNMED